MNVRNEYSTERVHNDGESDDEIDGANDENLSSDDGDMAMIEEDGSSSDSDSLVSQFEDCSEDEAVGDTNLQADGIAYSLEPISPARRSRNILTEVPRPLVNPENELSAFELFISEDVLLLIQRFSNRKASDLRRNLRSPPPYTSDFSIAEIRACIGITIRAGSDRDNFTAVDDLWQKNDSRPFSRATMSLHRFKFFLRCVRFDNFRSRAERQQSDVLAAIREFWDIFSTSLLRFYVPDSVLTIDEQLVGYRGSIPGRTYIPSKPRKYGLKIFWICESSTGYVLKGLIYTGRRPGEPIHRNLAKDVVLELCEPFRHTHRDIVTDNFFTSHSLAVDLLKIGLTLLGTMRSNRRELPAFIKDKNDMQQYSSKFVFDHENKITVAAYCPKRHRQVILLSSSHTNKDVCNDQKQKPMLILDYNVGKGGVDRMDQAVESFTCRRKTVRWPLLIFYNCLDIAAFNAFIILNKNNYQCDRKQFLRKLSFLLCKEYAEERIRTNKFLSKDSLLCASLCGYEIFRDEDMRPHLTPNVQVRGPRRCFCCKKQARSKCSICSKSVCPLHRRDLKKFFCYDCFSHQ